MAIADDFIAGLGVGPCELDEAGVSGAGNGQFTGNFKLGRLRAAIDYADDGFVVDEFRVTVAAQYESAAIVGPHGAVVDEAAAIERFIELNGEGSALAAGAVVGLDRPVIRKFHAGANGAVAGYRVVYVGQRECTIRKIETDNPVRGRAAADRHLNGAAAIEHNRSSGHKGGKVGRFVSGQFDCSGIIKGPAVIRQAGFEYVNGTVIRARSRSFLHRKYRTNGETVTGADAYAVHEFWGGAADEST